MQKSQATDTVKERILTAKQAAGALAVSEACIRRWLLTRKISSYRIGRLVRISESEIKRVLESGFIPAREARGSGR